MEDLEEKARFYWAGLLWAFLEYESIGRRSRGEEEDEEAQIYGDEEAQFYGEEEPMKDS